MPSKQGRPATAGTRKGNGGGWGGPARGEGSGNASAEPFADGNPGGPGPRPTYKSLSRQARIDALKEMQWDLAHDAESEVVRHNAQNALLDREEGKAVQRSEVTGKDGEALVGGITISLVKPNAG